MNTLKKNIVFILLSLFVPVYAKKLIKNNISRLAEYRSWFKIESLKNILNQLSDIMYQQCFEEVHFEFNPFFNVILARLAMLEMHGIEYDCLYVQTDKKFMKETLELWGIDSNRIISPEDKDFCLEADELIVPSYVLNKNQSFNKCVGFNQNLFTSQYASVDGIKKIVERWME